MSKNTPKPSRSRTQWQPNLLISTDSRQLSNNQLYEPINPQSPRRAAEGAAVTRQMLEISLTAMEDGMARMKVFCPLNNEKAPFLKILNDVLLAKTSREQAVETLKILIDLISKVIEVKDDPVGLAKYGVLRYRNPKMKRCIIKVAGSIDYLVLAGFRNVAKDFEEVLQFINPTSSRINKLEIARYVLIEVSTRNQKAYEDGLRNKKAAEDEAIRLAKKRLTDCVEDARDRKDKEDRANAVRRARRGGEAQRSDLVHVPSSSDYY